MSCRLGRLVGGARLVSLDNAKEYKDSQLLLFRAPGMIIGQYALREHFYTAMVHRLRNVLFMGFRRSTLDGIACHSGSAA